VSERALLLAIADDELVLGWRNSEWTGIAPVLEEDVAFSSIAQNEIGHARALYQLLSDDADALAFDREPAEYRCSPLVELRFVPDWARTIARHVLYEAADQLRIERLKSSSDTAVAGLAAKIDREEVYHRLHAGMWADRLRDEPRYRDALDELWPYAVSTLEPGLRDDLAAEFELDLPSNNLLQGLERGSHVDEWPTLWEEMTMVRRSVAGASW
jgi:ring-1,2-phenylacetyl-CoA epoxidase subunit PaaC